MHVCTAITRNCYATSWSYGEICVHCGCCSTNKKTRWEARLKYCTAQLDDQLNFDRWIKGLIRIQRNVRKTNIKYYRRRIGQYRRLLQSPELN